MSEENKKGIEEPIKELTEEEIKEKVKNEVNTSNIKVSKISYFKIYEKLYRLGYHSKLKNHGQYYVDNIIGNTKFESIIEIGCSQGLATLKFQKARKRAYGFDAANIAVRYAAKEGIPNVILGSATDIPFKDNFVDAIFSCDVLEHLIEKDVHIALKEIKRVTKRHLFLVLDCEAERNKDWIAKAKKGFARDFKDIDNLHMTVWSREKWIQTLRSYGFKFVRKYKDLYEFIKI